jgi:hypothetical protein
MPKQHYNRDYFDDRGILKDGRSIRTSVLLMDDMLLRKPCLLIMRVADVLARHQYRFLQDSRHRIGHALWPSGPGLAALL